MVLKPNEPAISYGWTEGKYFDLWMFVHFLWGVVTGGAFYFLGTEPLTALIIALVLFVLLEVVENAFGIEEFFVNRAIDVGVDVAGFFGWDFVQGLFNNTHPLIVFGLVFFTVVILQYFGWRAHQKRVRG